MMPHESALYFLANLALFGLVLFSWAHLFRRGPVTSRAHVVGLSLFLSCQGIGLLWSGIRLEPWAFAHLYLSTMLFTEAVILLSILVARLTRQTSVMPIVLTLAFPVHSCALLLLRPPTIETLQISPFARSPWYLLQLLAALAAFGAYACSGAGAIGYLVASLAHPHNSLSNWPSAEDCQIYTKGALAISFPLLSGALIAGALWGQLAWGSYWSWRQDQVWLLVVWLILTMSLHARSMRNWQGKPLALLTLLGLILALLALPALAHGLVSMG